MTVYHYIFYFFEVVAAASAIALVFTRNVFYGALLLIVCLLAVAGLYILSFAEFIAITQIMVYAGGVLVLIIFGIMLTSRLGEKPLEVDHGNVVTTSIVAVTLFVILVIFLKVPEVPRDAMIDTENQLEQIGVNLLTSHLLPFEVAGILLLAALVGAAVIASRKSHKV